MPKHFDLKDALKYLQGFLTYNKARGMVAEISLNAFVAQHNSPDAQKVLAGAWLISPNVSDFYKYRHAVFVLPHLYEDKDELLEVVSTYENDRGFQALATFLYSSGMGVILSGATIGVTKSIKNIAWNNFIYDNQRLRLAQNAMPFDSWPGRGRISSGNRWQKDVLLRFKNATPEQITSLTLRQAFYYSYLKQQLHKALADPYDVDAFVVGFRGAVMPMEVKEKSPTEKGDFGLDAGRILMMLRLCLATDSNGLYLIREVDNTPNRRFVRWRFITLSNLIMGCSWNLQAGGRGMGGGQTQTVMFKGALFEEFDMNILSEDWLAKYSSLNGAVKDLARTFANDLSKFLRTE